MNYTIHTFELTRSLEINEFAKQIEKSEKYNRQIYPTDFGYIDESFIENGVGVEYYSKRKKKVKIIVNPSLLLDRDDLPKLWKPTPSNLSMLKDRLNIIISKCFYTDCALNDMKLSRLDIASDINVGSQDVAAEYIKYLHNIGKVKGYSSIRYSDGIDKDYAFVLIGNSTDVEFWVYTRRAIDEYDKPESTGDKLILKPRKGILRVEVRLTSPSSIHEYTDETTTSKQIKDMTEQNRDIFLNTFSRVVPRGDCYKKKQAEKIITEGVTDNTMRNKMLRLLELIPEKKSLLLGQKALNVRDIKAVVQQFAELDLSPVVISKRRNCNRLDSLYSFLD